MFISFDKKYQIFFHINNGGDLTSSKSVRKIIPFIYFLFSLVITTYLIWKFYALDKEIEPALFILFLLPLFLLVYGFAQFYSQTIHIDYRSKIFEIETRTILGKRNQRISCSDFSEIKVESFDYRLRERRAYYRYVYKLVVVGKNSALNLLLDQKHVSEQAEEETRKIFIANANQLSKLTEINRGEDKLDITVRSFIGEH